AYFAELYSDDFHVDDLYYVHGVYRGNVRLRARRGVYPMIAAGVDAPKKVGVEALKICKTVRTHGYFGVYEKSQVPLREDGARLHRLVRALNACTRARR